MNGGVYVAGLCDWAHGKMSNTSVRHGFDRSLIYRCATAIAGAPEKASKARVVPLHSTPTTGVHVSWANPGPLTYAVCHPTSVHVARPRGQTR